MTLLLISIQNSHQTEAKYCNYWQAYLQATCNVEVNYLSYAPASRHSMDKASALFKDHNVKATDDEANN